MGHIRDLGGRLAVALEAVSRSDRLRRKAFYDDLTGLPNRDYCFARLDRAIKEGRKLRTGVAIMFVDLDGFKGINDTLGHIAGDELIRQAASRLSACVGDSGIVGRLGGDEFAIVLPCPVDSPDPQNLADQVLETIGQPFTIGSSEVQLGASIGIARFPDDGQERTELLRKADTAMYRAKESGRGRSVEYSDTMGIKVDQRLRLEADMRRALDNEEFVVYYQPQMDMRTGQIVSAEALVRWQHPERGLIPPNEFVPIAEDGGYIHVLGAWVMSTACKQLAQWQSEGLGLRRISVNVSAKQFRHHDFIGTVESSLLELLSNSQSLEIELTESVFVDDLNKARQALERLKATGVYISIDDFGTGYSSLGYLKHLTFDAVKVDQSFVHELPDDKKSVAIVSAVLAMCHTLDKHVVAEGIETDSQFHYLRKAGVDIGQGYRIGKPMPADHFARYVGDMQRRRQARSAC
jgi:diguanylate cyclase (GGDEF)-like protein